MNEALKILPQRIAHLLSEFISFIHPEVFMSQRDCHSGKHLQTQPSWMIAYNQPQVGTETSSASAAVQASLGNHLASLNFASEKA